MPPLFHIVLVEPQIPPNTGNIGRTCVGTHCRLHLIEPLGFDIDDKARKRAGLDYWEHLDFEVHPHFPAFLQKYEPFHDRFFFTSAHPGKIYSEEKFQLGDFFFFGAETRGLPEEMKEKYHDKLLNIPHFRQVRSFNLADSVSILLFEAWRQNGFCGWPERQSAKTPQSISK